MAWVDHDYHESWWDHSYCLLFSAMVCNLEFWIWLMQRILFMYSKSSSLHSTWQLLQTEHGGKKLVCLTSYMFTLHPIMGQVFYGTGLWPTWPIHICWPICLMIHDPLTHCLHCRCDSRVGGPQTMVLNTETGLKCVRTSITFIFFMSHTTSDKKRTERQTDLRLAIAYCTRIQCTVWQKLQQRQWDIGNWILLSIIYIPFGLPFQLDPVTHRYIYTVNCNQFVTVHGITFHKIY